MKPSTNDKPPKPPEELVKILRGRGLEIEDEELAIDRLHSISYYRLRSYFDIFKKDKVNFLKDASFDDGLQLYYFDRELRLLVLDALERIEIAFRSEWVRQMVKNDSHFGYLKKEYYRRNYFLTRNTSTLREQYKRYSKRLTESHQVEYHNLRQQELPVVWMAPEAMSFGLLWNWIDNLNEAKFQEFSKHFKMDGRNFKLLGRNLKDIRNICAHHGPLYNKKIERKILLNHLPGHLKAPMEGASPQGLHNILVQIHHLLSVIEEEEGIRWRNRVTELINLERYKSVKPVCLGQHEHWIPSCMGFPEDWEKRAFWTQ